jgi:hypothetical protein
MRHKVGDVIITLKVDATAIREADPEGSVLQVCHHMLNHIANDPAVVAARFGEAARPLGDIKVDF